jgi:CubicO group peptidase (beta-lactamase class C family)
MGVITHVIVAWWMLLAITTTAASTVASAPQPNGPTFAATRAFDSVVTDFMQEHNVPGLSVAVTVRGELAYEQGYGAANISANTKVHPDSLFRIASLTKMHTSAAILLLVQQQRLSLDDTVFGPGGVLHRLTSTLPRYNGATLDPRTRRVTVRQLLHHTGGWCSQGRGPSDSCNAPDPMFEPIAIATAMNVTAPPGPDDIVRFMTGQPLQYDPGTTFAYSNFGYSVLGRVIEEVSGQRYSTFVRENVWRALGIPSSEIGFGRTLLGQEAPNEVAYYSVNRHATAPSVFPPYGSPVPLPYGAFDLEAMDSHGAVIATARAIAQFISSLPRWDNGARNASAPSPPLLSNSTWADTLEHPGCGNCSAGFGQVWYGMGWMVRVAGRDPNVSAQKKLSTSNSTAPSPPEEFNAWHDGALDGTNAIAVHDQADQGDVGEEARQWVALLNQRTNGAEDGMMWTATATVKPGSWPLLMK